MHIHTAIKHSLFILLALCTFIGTTLPVDEYMLETKDGRRMILPQELRDHSKLIKGFVGDFSDEEKKMDPVPKLDLTTSTFEEILSSLESMFGEYQDKVAGFATKSLNTRQLSTNISKAIHLSIEDVQQKKAVEKNLILLHGISMSELEFLITILKKTLCQNPTFLKDEAIDDVHKYLRGSREKGRWPISNENSIGLLKAANYLDIPEIVQAASQIAANRIKWDSEEMLEWLELPEDIHYSISPYFMESYPDILRPLKLNIEGERFRPNEHTRFRGEIMNPEGSKYLDIWNLRLHFNDNELLETVGPFSESHPVLNAKFSPDGRYIAAIASGRSSATVYVFNAVTKKEVMSFSLTDGGPIRDISFSADSTMIAATARFRACFCHIDTNTEIKTIGEADDRISIVRFSPDKTKLLTDILGTSKVRVWDLSTGKCTLTVDYQGFKHITMAQWSTDGKFFVTASEDTATVWDSITGECMKTFEDRIDITAIDLSPDDTKLLLLAAYNSPMHSNKLQVYDVKSGRCLFVTSDDDDVIMSNARWPRFSLDGKKILFFAPLTELIPDSSIPRLLDLSEPSLDRYINKKALPLDQAALMVYFDKLFNAFERKQNLLGFLESIAAKHLIEYMPENLHEVIKKFPQWLRNHLHNKYPLKNA